MTSPAKHVELHMDIKRGMSSHGLSVYSRANSVKRMTFVLVDFVS